MPRKVMPLKQSKTFLVLCLSRVQHLKGLIQKKKKKNQIPGINLYEDKDNILFDPNV